MKHLKYLMLTLFFVFGFVSNTVADSWISPENNNLYYGRVYEIGYNDINDAPDSAYIAKWDSETLEWKKITDIKYFGGQTSQIFSRIEVNTVGTLKLGYFANWNDTTFSLMNEITLNLNYADPLIYTKVPEFVNKNGIFKVSAKGMNAQLPHTLNIQYSTDGTHWTDWKHLNGELGVYNYNLLEGLPVTSNFKLRFTYIDNEYNLGETDWITYTGFESKFYFTVNSGVIAPGQNQIIIKWFKTEDLKLNFVVYYDNNFEYFRSNNTQLNEYSIVWTGETKNIKIRAVAFNEFIEIPRVLEYKLTDPCADTIGTLTGKLTELEVKNTELKKHLEIDELKIAELNLEIEKLNLQISELKDRDRIIELYVKEELILSVFETKIATISLEQFLNEYAAKYAIFDYTGNTIPNIEAIQSNGVYFLVGLTGEIPVIYKFIK